MSGPDHPPSETHPACVKCALFKTAETPFWDSFYEDGGKLRMGMPDYSVDGGWVLVVGDGISKEMDEEEKVTDLSVLIKHLRNLGLNNRVVYVPGTLCVAPDGVEGRKRNLKKPEISRCFSHHIRWRVDYLKNLGLCGMIAAGPVASYSLLGHMDSKQYGQRKPYVHDPDIPVIGTIDVEATLVAPTKRPLLLRQLEFAVNSLEGRVKDIERHRVAYEVAWSAQEFDAWFEGLDLRKPLMWDIESSGIKPFAAGYEVGVFSFYHPSRTKVLIVATPGYKAAHEKYSDWVDEVLVRLESGSEEDVPCNSFDEQWLKLAPRLKRIIEDPKHKKLGHNQQFDDVSVFTRYRWNMDGYYADTMIWNYLLTPDEKRNGLEALVQKWYPEADGYWDELDQFKSQYNPTSYLEIPWDVLVPYAAYDTWVLWPVFMALLDRFKQLDDEEYGGLFVRRSDEGNIQSTYSLLEYAMFGRKIHQRMCTELEKTGAPIDTELLPRIYDEYNRNRDQLATTLNSHEDVVRFCSEVLGPQAKKGTANYKLWKGGEVPELNWGSPVQLKTFFLEFLGLKTERRTKTGGISLDETALLGMLTGHEVVKILLDWREADKFVTSFLDPLIEKRVLWPDGLTHASFRPSGTETSRLSVSNPNVQAIPRDGLVKKLYCPRDRNKGWLVTRDYSGLEVRVMACLSSDESLIETFLSGGDPHFNTQRHFFHEKADKKNKTQRSICKQALFGRIYGQTAKGLYELLLGNGVMNPDTGLPITMEEAELFNQMLDDAYPAIASWVKISHRFSISTKYVASPFGFVRPLDSLHDHATFVQRKKEKGCWDNQRFRKLSSSISKDLRRSQNTSIQSAAGDLTVFAGWEIRNRMKDVGLDSEIVNIVHDDIWINVNSADQVPMTTAVMRQVMDNSPDWLPDMLPGYDPSWITVPIIGECDVGINAKDAFGAKEPDWGVPDSRLLVKVPGVVLNKIMERDLATPAEPDYVDFLDNSDLLRSVLNVQRSQFN